MYTTTDSDVAHLTELQTETKKDKKRFFKRIQRFVNAGFKKAAELSATSLLSNKQFTEGGWPYTFGCLD